MRAQLLAYLDTARRAPAKWGDNDCCMFAAGWVLALSGTDLMAPYRGRYSTPLGACRLAKHVGGWEKLGAEALTQAGWAVVVGPPQAGDVVLCAMPKGLKAWGVHDGHSPIVPQAPRGIARRPSKDLVTAFRRLT